MLSLGAWLLVAGSARAGCGGPLGRAEIQAGMEGLEAALDAVDVAGAGERLVALGARLPCASAPMERSAFALFARYAALSWFLRQDEEQARRWLQSSRWADPDLPWDPERFPARHPLRRWADSLEVPPSADGSASHFVTPPGGGVVVAGHLLPRPEVPADLPVPVQVFDGDGRWLSGAWQDGNAFPDDLVAEGPGDQVVPAWWWRPEGADSPRARSAGVPVVPVAVGSALVGTGALAYALAGVAASSLARVDTSAELTAARGRANALVVVSASALAGGVGVGIGGVLLAPRRASRSP